MYYCIRVVDKWFECRQTEEQNAIKHYWTGKHRIRQGRKDFLERTTSLYELKVYKSIKMAKKGIEAINRIYHKGKYDLFVEEVPQECNRAYDKRYQ